MAIKKTTTKSKWADMSKAQKRVAVARDVLKQLKIGKYNAEEGTWAEVFMAKEFDEKKAIGCELQSFVKKAESCTVCGLGAVFVSLVRIDDRFKIRDGDVGYQRNFVLGDDTLIKRLKAIFSREQLSMIEAAFEKG